MEQITTYFPYQGCWDTRQGGRRENQDACSYMNTHYGLLLLVCDGMGGGPAGRLASTSAIDAIKQFMETYGEAKNESVAEILKQAIEAAHRHLLELIDANPSLQGMGTTVAALLINDQEAIVAHVGDSRVYQYRNGTCVFRTKDHSLVGEYVRDGLMTEEKARRSSNSNVITRALGCPNSEVEIDVCAYQKGDRFMLCSDGIWGMRPETELIKMTACKSLLLEIVSEIVEDTDRKGAEKGGGHDNLTIAMLETRIDDQTHTRTGHRRKGCFVVCIAAVMLLLIASVAMICFCREDKEKYVPDMSVADSVPVKSMEDMPVSNGRVDENNTVVASDDSSVFQVQAKDSITRILDNGVTDSI